VKTVGYSATFHGSVTKKIADPSQLENRKGREKEKYAVPGPEVSSPGGRPGAGAALVSQLLPQGASAISHISHPQPRIE
jgi:hypothetical protein